MTTVAPTQTASLDIDETYTLLSNARRRAVVDALLTLGEEADRSDVVDHVAATEENTDESDSDHRQRVYIGLHQLHFQTLHEAGVIEDDPDEGLVSRGPNFDYLARMKERGERSPDGGDA